MGPPTITYSFTNSSKFVFPFCDKSESIVILNTTQYLFQKRFLGGYPDIRLSLAIVQRGKNVTLTGGIVYNFYGNRRR